MRPMPQPAAEGRDGLPVPRFAERQSGGPAETPQHRADETGPPPPSENGGTPAPCRRNRLARTPREWGAPMPLPQPAVRHTSAVGRSA